ncbi:MAG: crotonase/enoyl-CoA hydratase family protein [Gammaproteobacteria bacterium]|nr:crotonase/enoyl-CoA hydratase family protein [Gammaproteobacteria bacterium]MBT8150591.1 crotonase/enoyl-CoA hydratase family protein [Gammaproteobacteria bacterium]NND38384.1 crotonase/enoyl-CoA hydratase family protein [Pseudomonadales bacterium]NNM11187.1 crotonase/enoyl-CoA hydratase family protein [Pseudomonadales bacterium]RZV57936.1 MAG: crotonase/enoyl-CoA hydratase family protein [Pseudomonadales bacterium]
MNEIVTYQLDDGVALVTLKNGKVNVLGSAAFAALNEALDRAEVDKAVVMLAGQPGIFSAGYDLKEMQQGEQAIINLVRAGSAFTRRMLAFPLPIVGVCTGNCIAKGAFVMLSCDYRVGVEGPFKIGLNETQIGMIMHHVGIEIPRQRLTNTAFNRAVVNAEMFDPQGAKEAGFLDRVVAPDELFETARAEALRLKALNLDCFAATKLKSRRELLEKMDWAIEQDFKDKGQR